MENKPAAAKALLGGDLRHVYCKESIPKWLSFKLGNCSSRFRNLNPTTKACGSSLSQQNMNLVNLNVS